MSGQTTSSRPGRSPRYGDAPVLGERPRESFALSWSGGKDSALVLWSMRRRLVEPEALITTVTEGHERISMHGVRRELLARQAEALGIPLVEVLIPPSCVNEIYEERMAEAFATEPLSRVDAIGFGDLFLEDSAPTARVVSRRPVSAGSFRSGGATPPRSPASSSTRASRRRSSASTRTHSTQTSVDAATTSACSPSCPPVSTPAARTASSTRSSLQGRSSLNRSPASAARSSSVTDSSSAT
jgi:Diphthamide synthase